jgi:hypothetical protein
MTWNRLIVVVGIVPLCGCTLIARSVYNINYDKEMRADLAEKSAEHRKLAQQAWLEYWSTCNELTPDAGMAEGFVDGFADYLDAGGSAEPPAVPPNQFRFGAGTSPAGRLTASRYAEGFTAGAHAARASGLRETSLVPVFLPIATPDALTEGSPPPPAKLPEALPTPRPLPSKPAEPAPVGRQRLSEPMPMYPGFLPPAGP